MRKAVLSARTTIEFPRLAKFLPAILDSLSAHDMPVTAQGEAFLASSPFGSARLVPHEARLEIELQASNGPALNRVRYSLTGLIGFVAKSEELRIEWTGDRVGKTMPPDLRILTVRDTSPLTPRMRRVIFEGDDLSRFDVRDQLHTRLLFQPEGAARPEWPMLDDEGTIVWPGGEQRLGSRIYTIRRIDASAGRMTIDFFDHGESGPGMRWLRRARAGDVVGAIGPAAHGPKPAKRVLLVGDETGLPGIARMLEHAPGDLEGLAVIEIADAREKQPIGKPEKVELRWLLRDRPPSADTGPVTDAVRSLDWGGAHSDLFVWVGCEYHDFRAIRRFLRTDIGLRSSQIVAFPHWRHGMSEEDIVAAGGEAVAG